MKIASNDLSPEETIEKRDMVDVSRLARKVGICAPVGISKAAWDAYISVGDPESHKDLIVGKVISLLEGYILKAELNRDHVGELLFMVQFERDDGDNQIVELKAACWKTDLSLAPIVAILLPEED